MSRWALNKLLVFDGTLIAIGLVLDICLCIKSWHGPKCHSLSSFSCCKEYLYVSDIFIPTLPSLWRLLLLLLLHWIKLGFTSQYSLSVKSPSNFPKLCFFMLCYVTLFICLYYPGSEAWVEISAFFFFFFFRVQSQIAVWSLKRMRHLCTRKAHGIYRSCRRKKLVRIPWFLRRWKSHTNEHTVRGRPAVDVKRLRNGPFCKPYERSIYERTFCVNLSRVMSDQRSYQPRLSTLHLDKKHL